jgi:hypothetical protein
MIKILLVLFKMDYLGGNKVKIRKFGLLAALVLLMAYILRLENSFHSF